VPIGQYLIGQGKANANTDPAMMIVPGTDQWLKNHVFGTPSGTADFLTDLVSIIVQTSRSAAASASASKPVSTSPAQSAVGTWQAGIASRLPAFDILGAPLAKDMAALSLALSGNVSRKIDADVGCCGIEGGSDSVPAIRAALTFRF
jgi:hypothetical protein